jgi:predicted ATP-grasp superfamily ATP-dependent carboligase
VTNGLNISSLPKLRRPVLLAAFQGWNDGGQGATMAIAHLARAWDAEQFAEIDPEEFFDFQVARPHVSLVEGETRQLTWPENAFYWARMPATDRDAVLLLGVEPNLRWRTFSQLVTGLAEELGVELLVSFGSLLADVPHTRPSPVTGTSSDLALVDGLGLERSRYEGPTGIVGILHDACRQVDIPSVSLWAAVPHYVSLAPSPRAAHALCERFGRLVGTDVSLSTLDQEVETYTEQVTEAVSADEDAAAYVETLEQQADEGAEDLMLRGGELPSGESIAAELTRFLRERDRDRGPEADQP